MPNIKQLTKPKEYTIERLQELRIEADTVGDTDTRDKLAAMIVERGGAVVTGEIPEDETKLSRLERLRRDALAVNDTDTAEKLAVLIAKEEPEIPIAEEPHTPHEGRDLVDDPPLNGGMDVHVPADPQLPEGIWDTSDPIRVDPITGREEPPVHGLETPTDAPQSDGERLEGPEATQPVNDGTASVNAAKRIKKEGWRIDEIPATDGKVTLFDLRRYAAMLTKV